MNTPAAFKCCYSDFKLIKTRGVVSISFEVPVEQAQTVLDVLGGMPVAASEVWCGIARLAGAAAALPLDANEHMRGDTASQGGGHEPVGLKPNQPRQEPATPDGAKKNWNAMPLAQQAGILCGEPGFRKFLRETYTGDTNDPAETIRDLCAVPSRTMIKRGTPAGDKWANIVGKYRTWTKFPELVP